MPDYAAIYDDVIERHGTYNLAEHSPGFKAVLAHAGRLAALRGGRSLDVGCGVGFVVELLGTGAFGMRSEGCDISRVAVARASERVGAGRIALIEHDTLPYADGLFDLVTCFDVVEHLDEAHLPAFRDELRRVLKPAGTALLSASTRPAGTTDLNGENVHRTIRPQEWWIGLFDPEEATVKPSAHEVLMWCRK